LINFLFVGFYFFVANLDKGKEEKEQPWVQKLFNFSSQKGTRGKSSKLAFRTEEIKKKARPHYYFLSGGGGEKSR
jgi:hypothetical protein